MSVRISEGPRAVAVEQVQEVREGGGLLPVPRPQPGAPGVVTLDGELVLVVDAARRGRLVRDAAP